MMEANDEEKSLINRFFEMFNFNLSDVAEQCGVSRSTVTHWKNEGFIPEKNALAVSRCTGNRISVEEVCLEAERCRLLKEDEAG